MNELWLTIKSWTQRIILAALVLYAGVFFYRNNGETIKLWYWYNRDHQTTVFVLVIGTFLAGIVFTILLSTALRTLRQIRDLRSRGRQEKIERDLADMKAKAAMLQTRPAGGDGVTMQVEKLGGGR